MLKQNFCFCRLLIERYAVMENMRHMLANFSSSEALHLGFRYASNFIFQGFMSGGSGYILTREAIVRLVEIGLKGDSSAQTTATSLKEADRESTSGSICTPGHKGSEDVLLGKKR